jgi:hypothetical protein
LIDKRRKARRRSDQSKCDDKIERKRQGQILGLGVDAREAHPEDPKEKPKNADGKTEHK